MEISSEDSGLAIFLSKRDPGLHHICLEVDDIEAKLDYLKGVNLIDEEPAVMDDARKLEFIHPKSAGGVLVKLYELP